MRIKGLTAVAVAAVLVWLLLVLAIELHGQEALPQAQCPDAGWLLGMGSNPSQVEGVAHGSLSTWEKGWTYAHDDHFDRVVVEQRDLTMVVRGYTSQSGVWIELREAVLYRVVVGPPCLWSMFVEPNRYMYFGHSPPFAEHTHDDVVKYVPLVIDPTGKV